MNLILNLIISLLHSPILMVPLENRLRVNITPTSVVTMIYRIMEYENKDTKYLDEEVNQENTLKKLEKLDDPPVDPSPNQDLEKLDDPSVNPSPNQDSEKLDDPPVDPSPNQDSEKLDDSIDPSSDPDSEKTNVASQEMFSSTGTSTTELTEPHVDEFIDDNGLFDVDNDDDENKQDEDEIEDEREEIQCDTSPDLNLLRNGLANSGFLWTNGQVPYEIAGDFNATQKKTIEDAVLFYNEEFKDCIKWIPKTDETTFVLFENKGSCSSRVGVAFFPFPVSQSILLGKCSHLPGHVKHEMMHSLGFYHEHSRSDRDMYINIMWENIRPEYYSQFDTYRWTTGYGEEYDYTSIMHYSSRAFVKDYTDKNLKSLEPKNSNFNASNLGWKEDLSEIDKRKIRKMYRCEPYADYKSTCSTDEECGINEYCAPLVSECRTKLPDGSICLAERDCLNHCSGGVCSKCVSDSDCGEGSYCAYKYIPAVQNECSSYCGSFCFFSAQCQGACTTCSWSFLCT